MRIGETEWGNPDDQALRRSALLLLVCAAVFGFGGVVYGLLGDVASAALAFGSCLYSVATAFVLRWLADSGTRSDRSS
jgi:Kef-type K+ transport system membrane component KefB